jgi:hypothetical protein
MSGPTHQKQMAERRAIIKGEQQSASEPSTMFAMSRLSNDLEGKQSARDYLAGQDEGVFYPKLPASSPWSGAGPQPGLEPSLGVAIDAQEACGEPFEVARSIAALSATASAFANALVGDGGAPSVAASPAGVAAPPTSSITSASTTPVGDGDGAKHSTVRNPVPNLTRPGRKL